MQRFRPAFRGDDRAFATAVYRITTLPARPMLIFTAVATIVSLPLGQWEMSQVQTGGLEHVPVLFLVILACLYLSSYPFFFHVWYQLREIHRLHRDHAQVRLSAIRPMYALSRVTGLTAIGIVIFNYGWFLAQPGADPLNPVTIGETLFNLVIILVIFAWPLWGQARLRRHVGQVVQVRRHHVAVHEDDAPLAQLAEGNGQVDGQRGLAFLAARRR